MEKENFITKQDAFAGFKKLRTVLNDCIEHPQEYRKSFIDMLTEVGTLAMDGNAIAQDVMSYYYKDGVDGAVPENYDLYMQWAILAAANGNEFTIEKLQFFLGYAFEEIVASEKLPLILSRNGITEKNYVYVLGNLLCEGIVDELEITAKKLVEAGNTTSKFTPEKLRSYRRALDNALPKVLNFLLA